MSAIDRVLAALEKEQQEFAVASLKTPKGDSSFVFGQASGRVQGLERAIEIIIENLKEPADDESEISSFERNLRGRSQAQTP